MQRGGGKLVLGIVPKHIKHHVQRWEAPVHERYQHRGADGVARERRVGAAVLPHA